MKIEKVFTQRIRCYDNGGKTFDRYTVIYLDHKVDKVEKYSGKQLYEGRGLSTYPTSPQGFGLSIEACVHSGLGKRISFDDLPIDCQKVICRDLFIKK